MTLRKATKIIDSYTKEIEKELKKRREKFEKKGWNQDMIQKYVEIPHIEFYDAHKDRIGSFTIEFEEEKIRKIFDNGEVWVDEETGEKYPHAIIGSAEEARYIIENFLSQSKKYEII